MQSVIRHNLTLTGSGSSSGGVFRNVKILGDARIDGDLDCLAFKCTGTANVTGSVKSTSCRIHGEATLKGNLETGKAAIVGTLEIGGDAKGKEIISKGETRILGNLAGEDLHLEGVFMIDGNCEAETMRMKGVFTIQGLLNAGAVEMNVHSRCRIREIGGEKIEVRRGTGFVLKRLIGWFYLPADFYKGVLHAETIEGDDIYVEHTVAEVIRGTNVIVGPGCNVGRVEFANRFEKTDDSVVSNHVRV